MRKAFSYLATCATVAICAWASVPVANADLPADRKLSLAPDWDKTALTPNPVPANPHPSVIPAFHIPTLTLDSVATTQETGGSSTGDDQAELVKKLNNPISNLISVPFQYNADFGIGPKNASRSTLNIQPVIPIALTPEWNVIIRTILPVIYADSPANGISTNWGLGDTTQSFFFSPTQPTFDWIWGIGPVFLWPTGTDTSLGSGKWGAGPTIVLLQQKEGWTYGMLANHIWSYAGDGDRQSVNSTFLQPFIAYQFPTYTTITLNTESSYDWSRRQWTVPINLMVAQLIKIEKQPMQFQIGGRYYAEGPSGGPEWGLRFTMTFLFPK